MAGNGLGASRGRRWATHHSDRRSSAPPAGGEQGNAWVAVDPRRGSNRVEEVSQADRIGRFGTFAHFSPEARCSAGAGRASRFGLRPSPVALFDAPGPPRVLALTEGDGWSQSSASQAGRAVGLQTGIRKQWREVEIGRWHALAYSLMRWADHPGVRARGALLRLGMRWALSPGAPWVSRRRLRAAARGRVGWRSRTPAAADRCFPSGCGHCRRW